MMTFSAFLHTGSSGERHDGKTAAFYQAAVFHTGPAER